jgi:hypothetical protein
MVPRYTQLPNGFLIFFSINRPSKTFHLYVDEDSLSHSKLRATPIVY